jgi:hypothetical protein
MMQSEQAPAITPATITPAEQVVILEDLARQANEHFEDSLQSKKRCRDAFDEHLKNVLLCGKALNDARDSVAHGKWDEWVKDYCPKIDRDTVTRYMRVAKKCHDINLEDCKSMRQVYQAVGILPSPEAVTTTADSADTQVFNFKPIANGAHILIRAAERVQAISEMPDDDKDALRVELERAEHAVGVMLAVLRGEDEFEIVTEESR